MGWGKGGKGFLGLGKGGGKGWHHHHHGIGPLGVAAEVAVVGCVTAAVVAATVARPRPRRELRPVVVVGQDIAEEWPLHPKGWGKGKCKGKGKGYPIIVQQQPEPPLNVASVWIPSGGRELRGDVTFYGVDVAPIGGGVPLRVMRRYTDFNALADSLGPEVRSFSDAPFPKKLWIRTADSLEGRRRGLEVWIQRAVQHPKSTGTWLRPLREFLAAVHQEADTAASRSPSAPAREAFTSDKYEDEGEMLEILIPAGVCAGQLLGVTIPSGRQLTVTVPEGQPPGSQVEVWFDRAAGTLQCNVPGCGR